MVRGADWDVWTLVRDGEKAPEVLYDIPGMVHHAPEFSPDGKWIAYGTADNPGDQDIYVEPFPPTGARRRISRNGGTHPMWSPDGSELFYRRRATGTGAPRVQTVNVTTAPDFSFGNEHTLPIERFLVFSTYRDYDITPDGERFVMVFPASFEETGDARGQRIEVVLNWFEHLRERAPN